MLYSPLSSQGCPLGVCAVTCPLGAPGGESCQQGDDGVSAFLPRQCRSGCQWGEKSPFQVAQPVMRGRFGGTPECCTAQPSEGLTSRSGICSFDTRLLATSVGFVPHLRPQKLSKFDHNQCSFIHSEGDPAAPGLSKGLNLNSRVSNTTT